MAAEGEDEMSTAISPAAWGAPACTRVARGQAARVPNLRTSTARG